MTDPNTWRASAVCRSVDPDLFFPDGYAAAHTARKAKAVCRTCLVKVECAREALEVTPAHLVGVWAGEYFDTTAEGRKSAFQKVAAIADRPISKRRRGDDERDRRMERIAELTASGWSANDIAAELKVSSRQVCRDRELLRYRNRKATQSVAS
ncbi:MAG: WhiB family transcriptional regulator [Rhodococcus sp. (in: high G+C Gram-positive bacteria)]